MKTKVSAFLILLFLALFFRFGLHRVQMKTPAAPHLYLPEETFKFTPVIDGQAVRHDFAVLNKGNAPLDLMEIKPDCGCTTVSYPKQIPAGGKGAIVIDLDTTGYSAQHVAKSMLVRTNDKNKPDFNLVILGYVKPFADINPAEAKLTGTVGQEIKQTVTIASTSENRFKILGIKAETGDNIRYHLVEMNQPGEKKYELTVYNKKKEKGTYIDTIQLRTDSNISPVVKIPVLGVIRSRL